MEASDPRSDVLQRPLTWKVFPKRNRAGNGSKGQTALLFLGLSYKGLIHSALRSLLLLLSSQQYLFLTVIVGRPISTISKMSLLLSPRSSYSLFPTCSDPLSKRFSNENSRRHSSRRIFDSRQATDISLCDRGKANENLAIVRKDQSPVRMGGRLIPLRLQSYEENPSQRTSYSSTTPPSISSTSPTTSRKQRPGPVTDLIIVPHTEEEWKTVMVEVKTLYLKGQYKHCSTRCKQILDGITVRVSKNVFGM